MRRELLDVGDITFQIGRTVLRQTTRHSFVQVDLAGKRHVRKQDTRERLGDRADLEQRLACRGAV